MGQMNLRIDDDLKRRFMAHIKSRHMSASSLIVEWIKEWTDTCDEEGGTP